MLLIKCYYYLYKSSKFITIEIKEQKNEIPGKTREILRRKAIGPKSNIMVASCTLDPSFGQSFRRRRSKCDGNVEKGGIFFMERGRKRIWAMLLMIVMVLAFVPNIGFWIVEATTFVPRKTEPSKTGYYGELNPFSVNPNTGGNCTWYAWGRAYEILGSRPNINTMGNACKWYQNNIDRGGYPYGPAGSAPALGAIACWSGGDGHVAVVEEIYDDGTMLISHSSWSYGWLGTRVISQNGYYGSGYTFQGFIYINGQAPNGGNGGNVIDANPGSPFPMPTRNLSVGCEGMDVCWVQKACNAFTGSWMPVNGVYDSATAYFVRVFQKEHGLEADGIAGPLTVGKMKSLWPAYEPMGDLWGAECTAPGKIRVWGWGFDEDALDQAINIKIYIYAAEGNTNSESDIQIIKAKSQHEVYGHTGPYYFEETLTTKAKGDVYVVAYGMNIGGGNAEAFFGRKNISVTPKVDVTSVSLDKTTISLKEEETITLKATVSPSNATNPSIKWSSNKTSVATVSSTGVVTAKGVGQATITATADGKSATCVVNVTPKVTIYKVTLDAGEGKIIVNGPDASYEHPSPWVIEVPEGSSVKDVVDGNWYGTDDDVYTQIGWVDQDKNEYLMDESGLFPSLHNLVPTKDMTITPIWKFYPKVTIDWNGGEYYTGSSTLSGSIERQFRSHDDLNFDDSKIIREGYTFGGWMVISGTNKGTIYSNQQMKTIYSPTENSSIMAMWTVEPVKQGWKTENGKKYYYKDGTKLTGLQLIDKAYYVFDADGVMQTGWQTISGKKYYFGSDGVMKTGWQKINKKWYYFKAGVMQTGWQKVGGVWYYFKAGVMVTGWQSIGGKWYFFKTDGSMAANEWCKGYWLNKDGTWTFKKKATWNKDKTGWWFGCSGWYAKNQWQKIDEKWYYFDKKGYIVTGTRKIGSKTYKFNSSGVCLNP